MARLLCSCGFEMSNVASQESNGYFISDKMIDDGGVDIIVDGIELWICPSCERLAFGDNPITWYKKDD